MDFNTYIIVWVCVIGLCLGSFYNVVILRSLSNESIVYPPSKCPKCGHKLYWWHNIPVLSYILLKAKCFFCKEPISIQYPLIEIITATLFLLAYWKFGMSYTTIFVMFWLSCLIIMTSTDIKEKVVDCNISIVISVSGVLYNFLSSGKEGAISSLLGLLLSAFVIEVVARAGYLFTKNRAMGEGDTYVAGALGSIFGANLVLPTLLYSLIASMFFILPAFLYSKYKQGEKLTLILSTIFIISVFVHIKFITNYYTLFLVASIGILLAHSVLKGLKNPANINYLPYVPALSASALYIIFFVL